MDKLKRYRIALAGISGAALLALGLAMQAIPPAEAQTSPPFTPTKTVQASSLSPKTGTGSAVLNGSPTFTGTAVFSAATFSTIGFPNVARSSTAPTISSGGCTSPAITWNNGTAAFRITIGTSCAGVSTVVLALPATTNAWICHGLNASAPATSAPAQSVAGASNATITNYSRTTGVATDFTAGDILAFSCTGG